MTAASHLPRAHRTLYVFDLATAERAADAYAQRLLRERGLPVQQCADFAHEVVAFLRSKDARPLVFISHNEEADDAST